MSTEAVQTVPSSAGDLPVAAGPKDVMAVGRRPATATMDEEARSTAVSSLLATAYEKASILNLSETESKALIAPFGDEQVRSGAKGDERLLYISHIHLSDRLNAVLGIGQWCLVKRSQRGEAFKSEQGKSMVRVYYEGVMLIRGAFVAEAIGVGVYHPNNPKEDFGTALESAQSDCLSRCCKRLGIGSQCWDKGYCDTWLQKYGNARPPVRMPTPTQPISPSAHPTPPPSSPADAATGTGSDPAGDTPPSEQDGEWTIKGIIDAVTTKDGQHTDGTTYTRFGVKLGGKFYGTFDTALGEQAVSLKGQRVTLTFTKSEKGGKEFFNIVRIDPEQ